MAEKLDYKVSYVRITDEGLERHNNVMLNQISNEDKLDIKALTFLPVNSEKIIDVTKKLVGFPILEHLYLPSMMTTTVEACQKECPMLKSLLLLSHQVVDNSLDKCVVKVNAEEEEGDNTAKFRTFVTTTKDGKNTFLVNSKQVKNREIIIEEKAIERLTLENVEEYILGENGIINSLNQINEGIEDERCKIDISQEVLDSLLNIFVEKGVTFEEFTIDFSRLYDKIESYKAIAKSVNQVSIKEEVEGNIIEAYQNVIRVHYENLLKGLSETINKLVSGTNLDTEVMLLSDLTRFIANVVVDSPDFDEDYKEGDTLASILSELPTAISRNIKTSKARGLVRKYLSQVISDLKTNPQLLYDRIEQRLSERVSLDWIREIFAGKFGLDLNKKPQLKLANQFVSKVSVKNLGSLVKDDITNIIDRVLNEMGNGEIRSKEMLDIITRVVADFPTKEEISNVFVDFVARNGYSSIKFPKA